MSSGTPHPFFFDLTAAREGTNLERTPSDAPAPAVVHPYSLSHAGPSSGSGSAAGPIRSVGVPSSRSRSVPYTSRPRSSELRAGQVQHPLSNAPQYYTSPAEEWTNNAIIQSELTGSGDEMAATVIGSAGRSSSLAPLALIAKREEVEALTSTDAPASGNWTGSQMQIRLEHPYAVALAAAWQPSSPMMMAPLIPSNAAAYFSTVHAQPRPRLPTSTTVTSSAVQQAYTRLAAESEHYSRCTMQECKMQHWDGIVSYRVWKAVAQREGPKWPMGNIAGAISNDFLALYPKDAALIHGTLRWGPAWEIHLHSLYSASPIDANGRDLTTAISGFDKIPGSLQLLVMLGGERLYNELRIHFVVKWKVLSVVIGNALHSCGLVICNEFWKQLETEKVAIEAWRKDFYVNLFVNTPDPRTSARYEQTDGAI